MVDDIVVEFAKIEVMIDESPEFALSYLNNMKNILESRFVPENDWKRYNSLQSEISK